MPSSPPAPHDRPVNAESFGPTATRRQALFGYAIAPSIGLLFAVGMHFSIPAFWPLLTLLLALTLFMLALIVPAFSLRSNLCSLAIIPFCSYITNNFDVGYGRTYTAPGIAMLLATLLFVLVIGLSIMIKTAIIIWPGGSQQDGG